MGVVVAYIVRLVGYALLIGIPVRIAEYFWQRATLDQVDLLSLPHSIAAATATIAPFVLAVFGFGALRNAAIFVATALAGAALTAPFALARLATTG
jgi:hypothetical protein